MVIGEEVGVMEDLGERSGAVKVAEESKIIRTLPRYSNEFHPPSLSHESLPESHRTLWMSHAVVHQVIIAKELKREVGKQNL